MLRQKDKARSIEYTSMLRQKDKHTLPRSTQRVSPSPLRAQDIPVLAILMSKLVCSHLQLRHLMLLSQTEEPEVYPLSTAILEAEIPFLDQSDRSTQIVLSIGPICLGLALSSS